MDERRIARLWAMGALVVAWNAPFVASWFLNFPVARVWAAVSVALAVAVVVAWLVPGLRGAAFVPDAAERGAVKQVAAAAVVFVAAAGFLLLADSLGLDPR